MHGRKPLLLCAVTALLALAPAAAQAAGVPDPATRGPHTVGFSEYSLPKVLVGKGALTTGVRPSGDVFFPKDGVGPYPVLVFLHGNHETCTSGPEASYGLLEGPSIFSSYDNGACSSDVTGDPDLDKAYDEQLAVDESRSYKGYDYLGDLLASQGYVVVSIDVNDITAWGENGNEAGYLGRVEMLSKTLDLVAKWNADGGAPGAIGDQLKGRADLSRVGVMGHSRGGEGVDLFSTYNAQRPATAAEAATQGLPDFGPRYPLKAIFALAPTDGQGGFNPVVKDTAYATALPACDGDVFDLEGAPVFERSKGPISASGHPAIQFEVAGANHNYFNTDWANDDADLFSFGDPSCVAPAGPTRLTKSEEKAVGVAFIGGFLRDYVGGESQFDPIMRGEAIPASACPANTAPVGVTCGDVVRTSYVAPASQRRVLLAPGAGATQVPDATPAGDPVTLTGFTSSSVCKPKADPAVGLFTTGCGAAPDRSPVEQLSLSWAGPASLSVGLGSGHRDLSGFGTLVFRAGTDYTSPLNPPALEPVIDVTLTDAAGKTKTVASNAYSSALEPSPGTTSRKEVLNGVRIPLAAFTGVDLTTVKTIALGFGASTLTGSIQLTDLAVQEPGKPAPAPTDPTPTDPTPTDPTPTNPTPTDPTPTNPTQTQPSSGSATPTAAPASAPAPAPADEPAPAAADEPAVTGSSTTSPATPVATAARFTGARWHHDGLAVAGRAAPGATVTVRLVRGGHTIATRRVTAGRDGTFRTTLELKRRSGLTVRLLDARGAVLATAAAPR